MKVIMYVPTFFFGSSIYVKMYPFSIELPLLIYGKNRLVTVV
jgi:hypothetical protein